MMYVTIVAIAMTVVVMLRHMLAARERDEAVLNAWQGWAAAAASETLRREQQLEFIALIQQRDDYRRLWFASRRHAPETRDEVSTATGPRLYGDERAGHSED